VKKSLTIISACDLLYVPSVPGTVRSMLELKYDASFFESPELIAAATLAVISSRITRNAVSPDTVFLIGSALTFNEPQNIMAIITKYFMFVILNDICLQKPSHNTY